MLGRAFGLVGHAGDYVGIDPQRRLGDVTLADAAALAPGERTFAYVV